MGAPNHLKGTAIGLAAGGLPGVLGYQYDVGEEAKSQAEKQASAEEDRQRAIIQDRQDQIARIREAFGMGTSATAQENATRLADTINEYYNNYLSQNLRTVDDQYAGASRTSRQNLARVGQLGSGLDSANKSTTLADYLRGRQTAVSKAAAAKDALSASLSNQRLSFENLISGGGAAPDLAGVANQQKALLTQAQTNIPSNAVGDLFKVAGNTYYNGAIQQAQGNQGLSAFGFSDSNNSGRIS